MCRNLYSFVVYLYVTGSGSITSVGEERANLSAVVHLKLFGFCLERFPLPLGAWDGTESIRTQVNSYLSQFVLILVNSYSVFGQFVLIL